AWEHNISVSIQDLKSASSSHTQTPRRGSSSTGARNLLIKPEVQAWEPKYRRANIHRRANLQPQLQKYRCEYPSISVRTLPRLKHDSSRLTPRCVTRSTVVQAPRTSQFSKKYRRLDSSIGVSFAALCSKL
ncbi:hypothetical protein PIB30_074299, partial [Stylosanthes scabra]|nr:hypothetical protein [Stylosanthes scabra]